MGRKYSKEELDKLHKTLYEILEEIIRVCNIINTPFFMIGGSAIGVYFWKGIIPFDDDIDIGMKREDYEKFQKEAPKYLNPIFFLQNCNTDSHSPYYFAKVRKNNTSYIEDTVKNIKMHHGIFVDIIPFDRIPNSVQKEKRQRKIANLINICIIAKEVWLWKYFGKCEIEKPQKQTFLNCLVTKIVKCIIPKKWLLCLLKMVQTWYNKQNTEYYNNVMIPVDHIKDINLRKLEKAEFGELIVNVPHNLEDYLNYHYPILKKDLSEEEIAKYCHAPLKLSFD